MAQYTDDKFHRFGKNLSVDPELKDLLDNDKKNVNPIVVSAAKDIKDNGNEKEWAIISAESDSPMALRPIDDKILVLVDKFKTGYECKTCDGKGHTGEECPNCHGSGTEVFRQPDDTETIGRCRVCTVGSGDGRKSLKYKPCADCHGLQARLIVPETNERKPTTGKVIAAGQNANFYKVGTTVVFTNYTGTGFEINDMDLRVMKERDVLCEAKYLKAEKTLEEKRYTDLDKMGIGQQNE